MQFTVLLRFLLIISTLFLSSFIAGAQTARKIKVLLIDGQSLYHPHWPVFTTVLQEYLATEPMFEITHLRAPAKGEDMSGFTPDFSAYQVVVSTYDGDLWNEAAQKGLENFMRNGGGLVIVHAADNAFPEWPAYNEMIGLGGWGKRDERSGPYVYFSDAGKQVVDRSPGKGGHHGKRHEYIVQTRDAKHPIMKGLPQRWMHTEDELYEQLRGPAKNMTVLATAYAEPSTGGSGRHEPILMTIRYGKGRVFHTVLGHDEVALRCVGFKTTFLRGCQWAATGKVTIPVPANFPDANKTVKVEVKSEE